MDSYPIVRDILKRLEDDCNFWKLFEGIAAAQNRFEEEAKVQQFFGG